MSHSRWVRSARLWRQSTCSPSACHIRLLVSLLNNVLLKRLSQMILDKIFHGVLDQGRGCLLVFDEPEEDGTYGSAIEMLEQVGKVVDSLYAKVRFCFIMMCFEVTDVLGFSKPDNKDCLE